MITLKQLLSTQSLGEMTIQRMCNNVNMLDANEDPLRAIIVNAYKNHQTDEAGILLDIQYAINQLQNAKEAVQISMKANKNKPDAE